MSAPRESLPATPSFWRGVVVGYVLGCRVGMPLLTVAGAVIASFQSPWLGSAVFFIGLAGSIMAWVIDA